MLEVRSGPRMCHQPLLRRVQLIAPLDPGIQFVVHENAIMKLSTFFRFLLRYGCSIRLSTEGGGAPPRPGDALPACSGGGAPPRPRPGLGGGTVLRRPGLGGGTVLRSPPSPMWIRRFRSCTSTGHQGLWIRDCGVPRMMPTMDSRLHNVLWHGL